MLITCWFAECQQAAQQTACLLVCMSACQPQVHRTIELPPWHECSPDGLLLHTPALQAMLGMNDTLDFTASSIVTPFN